jgi:hypothetical protein
MSRDGTFNSASRAAGLRDITAHSLSNCLCRLCRRWGMQSIPLRFSRKVDASKTDDENLYLLKLRTALEEYQHSTPLLHLRESLRILCDRSTTATMNETPVRLLSIDGGGVRGLSALVLLEQLMEHVRFDGWDGYWRVRSVVQTCGSDSR